MAITLIKRLQDEGVWNQLSAHGKAAVQGIHEEWSERILKLMDDSQEEDILVALDQVLQSLSRANDLMAPSPGETPTRRPEAQRAQGAGRGSTAQAGRQTARRAGPPPAAPVGDDEDEDREDEKKDEGKEARSGFRPYVRIGLIVLAGLLVAAGLVWFLFFRGPATIKPATLGAPVVATAPAPSAPTPPQPNPIVLGDEDKLVYQFSPPMNFGEIGHLGWWLINIMVFVLLNHLRAEAIERGEPRDYLVVRNGIIALLAMLAFGDVIAMKLIQVCKWFDPTNCSGVVPLQLATYVAWGIGIAITLGMSGGAAMGGRYDLTPLGMGAFLVGTIVKQALTNPIMNLVGTALQVIGGVLHIAEILRHREERWQASTMLIVAFVFALVVRYLIEAAFFWTIRSTASSVPGYIAGAVTFIYHARDIPAFALAVLTGLGIIASTVSLGRMAQVVPENFRERVSAVATEAAESVRHDARLAFLVGVVVWLAAGRV